MAILNRIPSEPFIETYVYYTTESILPMTFNMRYTERDYSFGVMNFVVHNPLNAIVTIKRDNTTIHTSSSFHLEPNHHYCVFIRATTMSSYHFKFAVIKDGVSLYSDAVPIETALGNSEFLYPITDCGYTPGVYEVYVTRVV